MCQSRYMNTEPIEVKFISTVPGLSAIKDLTPKPAKVFTPQWFKDMPYGHMEEGSDHLYGLKTAKLCPALPETFSQGYIIPMWTDTILKFDSEISVWKWVNPNPETFKWDVHLPNQLLEHVPEKVSFNGVDASFIFKAICPWRIVTPIGYSVLQLPLFYHFKKDFSVMPGVINTDMHHEINQQILYHGQDKEVFIKRGEPFVQYIPYKRIETNFSVSDATEEDIKDFTYKNLDLYTSFEGNYLRRKREQHNQLAANIMY